MKKLLTIVVIFSVFRSDLSFSNCRGSLILPSFNKTVIIDTSAFRGKNEKLSSQNKSNADLCLQFVRTRMISQNFLSQLEASNQINSRDVGILCKLASTGAVLAGGYSYKSTFKGSINGVKLHPKNCSK